MTSRYPSYAPSSAPWVGNIPDHWSIAPLGAVLIESKVKNTGLSETNLLSLSYGRIVPRNINSNEGLLPESFETYQIVEPDQIVFRFTDLQNDQRSLRSARVTERGIVTSAYSSARPVGIHARYAEYLMRAYDTSKVFYGLGGGVRQSLKFADVTRIPVLRPPLDEQQAIADYLDREAARIDTLISEQQRLIQMLRERRAAISDRHFYARGGKRETTLRRVIRPLARPAVPGLGVVTAYRDGAVTLRSNRRDAGYTFSDTEHGYQEVRVGDLVFHALDGFAGAVGISDSHGNATPVYHVCEVISDDNPAYLAMLLRYLGVSGYLATQAPNVRQRSVDFRNWATFARVPVALPATDVQRDVVAEVHEQTKKIDTIIAETQKFIELAQERRSALITAAVYGQIDVREVA
ncbi:MAG: hypothetical protein K2X52_27120 [Mycobacteriaceae bacterium]|nr:hypothetical protein [Mycobacteriaceae bacterium]